MEDQWKARYLTLLSDAAAAIAELRTENELLRSQSSHKKLPDEGEGVLQRNIVGES
jgi:hypothetical protein